MKELLGLVVLSGPPLLFLLLLPVASWIAIRISSRFDRRSVKFSVGLVVFILVFLVPFGDEIAGRIYLSHLCATEAAVKVYRTVELPAEYWDKEGKPNFFNKQGYLDHAFWRTHINEGEGITEKYSPSLGIDKSRSRVVDKRSHELLGEVTTFRHWGGWIRRSFSLHNTADSCQYINEPNFSREFYGRLFKPASSSK